MYIDKYRFRYQSSPRKILRTRVPTREQKKTKKKHKDRTRAIRVSHRFFGYLIYKKKEHTHEKYIFVAHTNAVCCFCFQLPNDDPSRGRERRRAAAAGYITIKDKAAHAAIIDITRERERRARASVLYTHTHIYIYIASCTHAAPKRVCERNKRRPTARVDSVKCARCWM